MSQLGPNGDISADMGGGVKPPNNALGPRLVCGAVARFRDYKRIQLNIDKLLDTSPETRPALACAAQKASRHGFLAAESRRRSSRKSFTFPTWSHFQRRLLRHAGLFLFTC